MTNPREILAAAKTILLVDWPKTRVPRALLEAGFVVFGSSPGGFSRAELVHQPPEELEARVFPPDAGEEAGFLVFRKIQERPLHVDIVHAYRPAAELPGIIAELAVPLGATTLWLQPPGTSAEARRIAAERGLRFVEGTDIADTARHLGNQRK